MDSHVHDAGCSCTVNSAPYSQTVHEMDFERGIWAAAVNGETERVQSYIDKNISPNVLDTSGYTALHYACRHGHLNVCTLLLKCGANPNALTRSGKASPLHRAAHCGHSDIVKILIDYGAKLELHDSDGQTALHKAAIQSHVEVVKLLIGYQPHLLLLTDKWAKLPVDYITSESSEELKLILQPSK